MKNGERAQLTLMVSLGNTGGEAYLMSIPLEKVVSPSSLPKELQNNLTATSVTGWKKSAKERMLNSIATLPTIQIEEAAMDSDMSTNPIQAAIQLVRQILEQVVEEVFDGDQSE